MRTPLPRKHLYTMSSKKFSFSSIGTEDKWLWFDWPFPPSFNCCCGVVTTGAFELKWWSPSDKIFVTFIKSVVSTTGSFDKVITANGCSAGDATVPFMCFVLISSDECVRSFVGVIDVCRMPLSLSAFRLTVASTLLLSSSSSSSIQITSVIDELVNDFADACALLL